METLRMEFLNLKLQAVSMVCLIVAMTLSVSFADNNTTLLNAYIRHAVLASQDAVKMVGDKAGTLTTHRIAERQRESC